MKRSWSRGKWGWAGRAGLLAMAALLAGAGRSAGRAEGQFQNPSQSGIPSASQSSRLPNSGSGRDEPSLSRETNEKQEHARNDERQKRLIADSDKLLALATQLHDDVQKTNKNILSMDVVRRAAEMEKLSHDLKERMKG